MKRVVISLPTVVNANTKMTKNALIRDNLNKMTMTKVDKK